jgi:hypothetical protein
LLGGFLFLDGGRVAAAFGCRGVAVWCDAAAAADVLAALDEAAHLIVLGVLLAGMAGGASHQEEPGGQP